MIYKAYALMIYNSFGIDDIHGFAVIKMRKCAPNLILSIVEEKIPLTQNDVELILSFFLDATEEYMAYDHIDLEFTIENKSIDICIAIK
jgi:hypothetical protein